MSSGHADGTRSALGVAEARVDAAVSNAGEMVTTLRVKLAFTL